MGGGANSTSGQPGSANSSTLRQEIENTFFQIGGVVQKMLDPVPSYAYAPSNDDLETPSGLLADLKSLNFNDIETIIEYLRAEKTDGPIDDNDLLMEKLIQLSSKLPSHSKHGKSLSVAFVKSLWDISPHPPISSIGEQYQYRTSDGSHNNILFPDLGKAGTPYAKVARPHLIQNVDLPDPGRVFDSLMARSEDGSEEHPNKVSSMMLYMGTIIAHDLFRSDYKNPTNNITSSYLDLSPLYGSNEHGVKMMRTFQDGRLKPDCFSSKRILNLPPGVGAFLIMFNRSHNYIVSNLAIINEGGRFDKPDKKLSKEEAKAALAKRDNDLFQTARLVNCGLYINTILKDYVRTALNLQRTESSWDLDPRIEGSDSLAERGPPIACGNQVSIEFNFLYRWHSAVSAKDAEFTKNQFAKLFPDQDARSLDWHDLVTKLAKVEEDLDDDPAKRPFASLVRQASGCFEDGQLVDIVKSSIEDCANAFGANKVPDVFRSVEILGILSARKMCLATLNEFRSFLGLTKHAAMEDINPDPSVAQKLKNLYDHPDAVELYPGLVAEKPKPSMSPGAGLCLPFTTSRAILSDAFGAARGDRFYTIDYTPKSLTNWGLAEVESNPSINGGHVMYKLILAAFPNHFRGNSIYAHYPFNIPSESHIFLNELGTADLYDWSAPVALTPPVVVNSYKAVTTVLADKYNFPVTKGPEIVELVENKKTGKEFGSDSCLASDRPQNLQSRQLFMKALYTNVWEEQVKAFYEDITVKVLRKYAFETDKGCQVDIIRDVGNLAPAHFASEVFCLPLKTEENPNGVYTERELYLVLAIIIICIFFDVDVTKSFQLHQTGRSLMQQLGKIIAPNVEFISKAGIVADIVENFQNHSKLRDYGAHMIRRLLKSGKSVEEVVWGHILLCAPPAVMQGQFFAQTINYFLTDGAKHLPEINRLAKANTKETDEKLLRYAMEGTRLSHTLGGFRQIVNSTTIPDYDPTSSPRRWLPPFTPKPCPIHLPAGHLVFTSLRTASLDPAIFPNPLEVDLTRDMDLYCQWGWGPHTCAGMDVSKVAMTAMLKVVGGLDNLRIVGEGMKSVPTLFGATKYMTADQSAFFPFPTTLKVGWDGGLPEVKGE